MVRTQRPGLSVFSLSFEESECNSLAVPLARGVEEEVDDVSMEPLEGFFRHDGLLTAIKSVCKHLGQRT